MCLVGHARAQTARSLGVHAVFIEGTIRAPDGPVLPGVTVQIVGTKLTTISDAEGSLSGSR